MKIAGKFFKFEGAGILLRDVKTDLIFTLNEISKEEKEAILSHKFHEERAAKKQKKIKSMEV